jgi:hypothetical protein
MVAVLRGTFDRDVIRIVVIGETVGDKTTLAGQTGFVGLS